MRLMAHNFTDEAEAHSLHSKFTQFNHTQREQFTQNLHNLITHDVNSLHKIYTI
jgi:hypothetical protein